MPNKQHGRLNYVEYPAYDLEATKTFFHAVFDWKFTDFGIDYCSFTSEEINGGFYRSKLTSTQAAGGALLIFYSEDLEASLAKVESNGAQINKPIFSFPGGRRFHFIEPSGNEFAVWTDK
jgi:hypothetical protein